MGTGYTAMMYDPTDVETAISDIGACRYDGIEIGLGKVRDNDTATLKRWLADADVELYCVMSEWIESDEAVERIVEDVPTIADLGAEFLGLLPPQRGRYDEATVETWLSRVSDAALDAGLRPVVHHHGATAVERPSEIRHYLDAVEGLELLFDTAHYYPYGDHFPEGDVTDAVERFGDDIAYVHLKDVAPGQGFADNRDALTDGDFHLDNVINYFRSFTDLGDGVLEFGALADALDAAGYEGHYTIEIENQTEKRLVHAKENIDRWNELSVDGR
ncbi:sugar phosphate isomerase/epimerase family protein [Halomicrobium sp. HM KBTZ05]|uniref:sugar phosphate isomerase/epimerase family protein n=1 Tax=Halomicrobium sp. HM KBTZ05 TaxID=3242663 RepID=UPI0035563A70